MMNTLKDFIASQSLINWRVFSSIDSGDFDTIEGAIEAVPENGTLRLTSNITTETPIVLNKNMELDLNGQTITANGIALDIDGGAIVKLNNGTINASGHVARVNGNATLKIESGTYTSQDTAFWAGSEGQVGHIIVDDANVTSQEFSLGALGEGSTLEINGGEFTAIDNAVVAGNGTAKYAGTDIIINGGTFNGGITSPGYIACGVYHPQDGTLTINGGTFNITNGVGVLVRAGDVEINDGVTINTTGTVSGKVSDSRILANCSAIYVDGAANYPGWQANTSTTTINGGTFTSDVKIATVSLTTGAQASDHFVVNNDAIAPEDIDYI